MEKGLLNYEDLFNLALFGPSFLDKVCSSQEILDLLTESPNHKEEEEEIKRAVELLKAQGYKIYKPVTEFKEV